jgi:hypothetical protein
MEQLSWRLEPSMEDSQASIDNWSLLDIDTYPLSICSQIFRGGYYLSLIKGGRVREQGQNSSSALIFGIFIKVRRVLFRRIDEREWH